MSIFLGNFNKITDAKWGVGFQHNMPFDVSNGIKDSNGNMMTQDKLNQIGILVDSIPEPNIPTGQIVSGMFINPQTKEVFYEYADIPKSDSERVLDLQNSLVEAQNAINMLLGL